MGEEDPYQFIRCRRDSPRLQKLEKGSVSHGWTPPLSLHTHTQYTQRSARHSHIQKSLVKQTDRLRWELVWRSTIVNHGYHYSNYSYSNLFEFRDFSVGAEVQSSPSSAGDTGSTPGWGTKIPQAMVHLSLSAATREARMLQKRPDAAKKKKTTFFFKHEFELTVPELISTTVSSRGITKRSSTQWNLRSHRGCSTWVPGWGQNCTFPTAHPPCTPPPWPHLASLWSLPWLILRQSLSINCKHFGNKDNNWSGIFTSAFHKS